MNSFGLPGCYKMPAAKAEGLAWLEGDVVQAAKRLLGCYVVRESNGQKLVGKIVETEAYHQTDAASHSYNGQTPRTKVMFGSSGFAYVYFTYGMHYCMNIVCGKEGEGSAVLIRAIEPLENVEIMQVNRKNKTLSEVTNGPAKLCQALQIDKTFNGHNLQKAPLQLVEQPALANKEIVATTRIGITKDTHRKWRFYVRNNSWISKPH